MSIPWQEFVGRLESPPDNLSIIPNPVIDDLPAYTNALTALPTPIALYGASFADPSPGWSNRTLEWTQTGPEQPNLIPWASRALSEGIFDSQPWFEALSDEGNALLRQIFVQWGKDDLSSCLSACDKHFLPALRIPILTIVLEILLSIPYQPDTPRAETAMHTLACHPFIDTIITSLILDTANHLFPLGLRTILTVIPYAPHIITTKVPSIMVVLGRAVCWRDRPFLDAGQTSDAPSTYTPPPRREWSIALSADEKPIEAPLSLQPVNIVRLWLVAIYGAWPSNLLAFVRDPILYLRGKQVDCPYEGDWEDVWRPGLLAARTGPLLKDFSLHPSIMYFNSDGELQDMKRWDKVDPPEHVSRAHIIAHSERLSRGKTDFFEEDPESEGPSAQPSGAATPTNDSDKHPPSDVQRLQRENLWLRLEAGYADRLRKQYLYQLGRLHKNSMRFSVDEAEVHSFANRIKEERSARDALQNELAQHRRDAVQAQQKHSKWQESLREKLIAFREDKLNWQNEAASIRTDRSDLETTVLRQKAELAQVKNERFKLQNQLTEVIPKVRHIEDYEIRMKQLVDAQKLWDADVAEHKKEMAQAELWQGRVFQLEQLLRSVKRDIPIAPTPEPAPATPAKTQLPKQPDVDHYIAVAEHAQKRAEQFEREALELRVELDRMRREQAPSGGDRATIWGE